MKPLTLIVAAGAILAPGFLTAGSFKAEFADVEEFSDFSVSGLSEKKTLPIFQSELEREMEDSARKYLGEGEMLTVRFTDVDMAGDIQPWRNRDNADIRYIEDIYPPRLEFSYTLTDAEGEVLAEGEDSIKDLAFQMSSAAMLRHRHDSFVYEIELLKGWLRKTFRNPSSKTQG